jgi:hypothetical protein
VSERFEISGWRAHMTYRGRSLKMRMHHNIHAGDHGYVRNRPLFRIFRAPAAAHAEPTFLQFIIGLTRHRYRRIPSKLSDRFHHRHRWTGN